MSKLFTATEDIRYFYDNENGIEAIIAIDDLALDLGPAVGGCRFLSYPSSDAALQDVSRLARAMTYKAAIAGVNYRGGKSVILKPKHEINRQQYFKTFAKFLNKLQGEYITAVDSGTTTEDMYTISRFSPFVIGYNNQIKGDMNPSYYTAQTVLQGLLAATKFHYGHADLSNKKILIKGVGSVGFQIALLLHERCANIFVADANLLCIKNIQNIIPCTVVDSSEMLDQRYDILCPCDIDFTVTEKNITQLNTDIIVGATNNQLETDELAIELKKRGITYCPDYVVNSGGLIYVIALYEKQTLNKVTEQIKGVYDITLEILKRADSHNLSSKEAADALAEAIFNAEVLEAN